MTLSLPIVGEARVLTISIVTLSIPIVGGSAEPNIRAENVGISMYGAILWYARSGHLSIYLESIFDFNIAIARNTSANSLT